jgi:hypothetical protein
MVLIEWFLVYSENVCIHKRNANTFYAGVTFYFYFGIQCTNHNNWSDSITFIGIIGT